MQNIYDRLTFNFGDRHFEGKHVVAGLAVGLTAATLYATNRYFAGGWCNLTKDLTGKNVIITGGNTGIGKETARRFLELGANVIIGSRDQKKNREVVEELSKINKGKITEYKLDLGDKKSIKDFSDQVKNELGVQALHYLINNAGIMAIPEYKLTKDGFESQIGVNHFGHFYLTYLLWDKLKESETPRIVNLSSMAHESTNPLMDIDFNNIHYQNGGYHYWYAYSRSKKANILFTKELQRKMKEEGIDGIAVSLHPGAVRTDLSLNFVNNWWKKFFVYGLLAPVNYLLFKSPTEGAQTSIYCALENDNNLVGGGYYKDCKVAKTGATQVESREAARRLWEESERAFGIEFKI